MKYGARHLKRAIERLLVHPLSNLMATSQVSAGDWIQADFDPERNCLLFTKEAEGLEVHAMANLIGDNFRMPACAVMSETSRISRRPSPWANPRRSSFALHPVLRAVANLDSTCELAKPSRVIKVPPYRAYEQGNREVKLIGCPTDAPFGPAGGSRDAAIVVAGRRWRRCH